MELTSLPLPRFLQEHYQHYASLTPVQEKAVRAGLLDGASLLVCAPTASGKTFIATMAIAKAMEKGLRALYLVPLKALGAEKYKEYRSLLASAAEAGTTAGSEASPTASSQNLSHLVARKPHLSRPERVLGKPSEIGSQYKVGLATGDLDSESAYLAKYQLLILTTEKLDSLLRHRAGWLENIGIIIIDEIHLLNDPGRGPTLEIVITLLRSLFQPQLIGLSATIGNPQELADWLQATLVQDSWRPVELKKGIAMRGKVEYY